MAWWDPPPHVARLATFGERGLGSTAQLPSTCSAGRTPTLLAPAGGRRQRPGRHEAPPTASAPRRARGVPGLARLLDWAHALAPSLRSRTAGWWPPPTTPS